MTTLYAIRIDLLDGIETTELFIEQFYNPIKDIIERIFIVEEKGQETGKLHIQGIIKFKEITDKLLKNLRNIIVNKVLKKKSNKGDYSFSKVRKTEEDYMIYLCKGGEGTMEIDGFKEGEPVKTILQIGYTDEDIEDYRNIALERQEDYVKKTKNKPNIGQLIIAYMLENEQLFLRERHGIPINFNRRQYIRCYNHGYSPDMELYFDKEMVVKLTARFFSHLHKSFREQTVEGYYNLIEHQYIPDTTEERFAKALEDKLCYKFIHEPYLPNSIEEVPKPQYNPRTPSIEDDDEEEEPIWKTHPWVKEWKSRQ